MKTLVHLMRKEARYSFGLLFAHWTVLAFYILSPRLKWENRLQGESFFLRSLLNSATLIVPVLLMLVLIRAIHLDHPRRRDAFLLTRPVGSLMRWAPKILLWLTLAALPACAAVLLQLAVMRLDLNLSDYLRIACRCGLITVGCYGFLAAITTAISHRHIALVTCLAALAILAQNQFSLLSSLLVDYPANPTRLQFEPNRWFSAINLTALAGFVYCAWTLARASIKSLFYGLAAVACISLSASSYWTFNYLQRPTWAARATAARGELARLQANTTIATANGYMSASKDWGNSGPRQFGNLQCTLVQAPPEPLAWPRPYHGIANLRLKPANVPVVELPAPPAPPAMHLHFTSPFFMVMRPSSIIQFLGLPAELTATLQAHQNQMPGVSSTYGLNISGFSSYPFGKSTPCQLDGAITCNWYRPKLLASLPLRAGEHFAINGRSVTILNAALENNRVVLLLQVRRFEMQPEQTPLDLEHAPDFAFYLANTGRGELALPTQTSDLVITPHWFITARQAALKYQIHGRQGALASPPPGWMHEARLYVLEQQFLGVTDQKFSADMKVHSW